MTIELNTCLHIQQANMFSIENHAGLISYYDKTQW